MAIKLLGVVLGVTFFAEVGLAMANASPAEEKSKMIQS
jgi:hypothetical protein